MFGMVLDEMDEKKGFIENYGKAAIYHRAEYLVSKKREANKRNDQY